MSPNQDDNKVVENAAVERVPTFVSEYEPRGHPVHPALPVGDEAYVHRGRPRLVYRSYPSVPAADDEVRLVRLAHARVPRARRHVIEQRLRVRRTRQVEQSDLPALASLRAQVIETYTADGGDDVVVGDDVIETTVAGTCRGPLPAGDAGGGRYGKRRVVPATLTFSVSDCEEEVKTVLGQSVICL